MRVLAIGDGKYSSLAAARARRGGIRRLGVGRRGEGFLQITHFSGLELKGRIATVADMVETARGLAGINDIVRAALRA